MTKHLDRKKLGRKKGLTEKQRRFVAEYLTDCNAKRAAIAAGYSKRSAYSLGQRMVKHYPAVVAAIEAGQKSFSERLGVTRETIAAQLDEDRQLAREVGQAGAAVAASTAKAKLFGLMLDRHEHTGRDGGPIQRQDLTPEGVARDVEDLFGDVAHDPGSRQDLVH